MIDYNYRHLIFTAYYSGFTYVPTRNPDTPLNRLYIAKEFNYALEHDIIVGYTCNTLAVL